MEYAKLINGAFFPAPPDVIFEDKRIINPPEDILLSLGYLPVIYTPQPQAVAGYYFTDSFYESDGQIFQTWESVAEPVAGPSSEERIAALEAALLEIILGGEL